MIHRCENDDWYACRQRDGDYSCMCRKPGNGARVGPGYLLGLHAVLPRTARRNAKRARDAIDIARATEREHGPLVAVNEHGQRDGNYLRWLRPYSSYIDHRGPGQNGCGATSKSSEGSLAAVSLALAPTAGPSEVVWLLVAAVFAVVSSSPHSSDEGERDWP